MYIWQDELINGQGYLGLRIFQNRDLLKVNPPDGRRGIMANTIRVFVKGIHTVDLAVS